MDSYDELLKSQFFYVENLQFRENVAAWVCFYDRKDIFKGFLERVLRLKEGIELSIAEKTNYLVFMINAFQSLGDEVVSETVLRLASLQSWHSLSYGRFQELIKKWKRMIKREAKEATKRGELFDPSTKLEVKFLRNLIEEFLEVLDSTVFSQEQHVNEDHKIIDAYGLKQVDNACVLYCERFMKFLIDLLSQLPTRRYLRPLVADVAVVAKCHMSALYKHEKGKLFAQLVNLLQFYEKFEVNDHVGTQLTDDELRELALANIGAINKRADLSKKLSELSPMDLRDLVCHKLKLISEEDPRSERVDFLIEVMVSFFEKQQSQKEAINALPLYPNEQIMWDESLVPSINYSGEGCLALPKLNLQFLTLHDYLLRNFNLFRLESTYEIREDI
nr:intron-binding protein aquarius [Quercus suber]